MFSVSKYNLCRLCLCVDGRLSDIFEERYNLDFLVKEVIQDLLQLKVVKEVGLPWLVCSVCLKKLTDFRLFKSRCIECKLAFENRYKLDSEYASCGYWDNSNKAVMKPGGECSIGRLRGTCISEARPPECIPRDIEMTWDVEGLSKGNFVGDDEADKGVDEGRGNYEVAIKVEQEEDCGEVVARDGVVVVHGGSSASECIPQDASGEAWGEMLYPKVECVYEGESRDKESVLGDVNKGPSKVTLEDERDDEGVSSLGVGGGVMSGEEEMPSTRRAMDVGSKEEASIGGSTSSCDRLPGGNSRESTDEGRSGVQRERGEGTGAVLPGPYVPNDDLAECIKRDKRKYICELCGERFLGSQSLRLHVANHETDSFLSKVVEEKMQRKISWKVLSVHKGGRGGAAGGNTSPAPATEEEEKSGKRTYPCDVCERNFYWPTDLKRHKRTHDGSKPYECDRCSRAFALKSNLIRHGRIHVNSKPFPCRFCKKSFSDRCNMNKHERTHMGLKSYKCALCSKGFSVKDSLKTHLVGIHKLEGKEQLNSAMILPNRKA